jgi:glutamine amidotransferase
MITIPDYSSGNVKSVFNMLDYLGIKAEITSEISKIEKAEKLLLAGVGSFDKAMDNLKKARLIEVLNEKVIVKKTPILGICLGMQIMGKKSEEGIGNGLGWIDGETLRFQEPHIRIPHMMWNHVKVLNDNRLFAGLSEDAKFYFAHSFYFNTDFHIATGITSYGNNFISAFEFDNIAGVQFHPEKSHKYGMRLLHNFNSSY